MDCSNKFTKGKQQVKYFLRYFPNNYSEILENFSSLTLGISIPRVILFSCHAIEIYKVVLQTFSHPRKSQVCCLN